MAVRAALGLRHAGETGKGGGTQQQWFQGHLVFFSTVGRLFAPSRLRFDGGRAGRSRPCRIPDGPVISDRIAAKSKPVLVKGTKSIFQ
jgi:hypothetical protein